MAEVLVIGLCDPRREARVDRQLEALARTHEVTFAGLEPPVVPGVRFVRLEPVGAGPAWRRALNQALRFAGRHERAYRVQHCVRQWTAALGDERPGLVVANNVITLPLALTVANGAPVVLDAHEYAPTENDAVWWWRVLIRPSVRWMCRTYVPRITAMTTVSQGIADLYRERYGVDPLVVTNAPRRAALSPSPIHEPVRLFHFASADPQRRIEDIIAVARDLGPRYRLGLILVGGPPRYRARLASLAQQAGNVDLLEPVPMRDLPAFANSFDIGIHLLPPVHSNHLLALPNKFFDFVQARLAVAIGPSPEMARIAEAGRFGIVASDFEPESLAWAIRATDRDELMALKQNADLAAADLNAETNMALIARMADRALGAPVA